MNTTPTNDSISNQDPGPMARTVRDVALGYSILSGPAGREGELLSTGAGVVAMADLSLAEGHAARAKLKALRSASSDTSRTSTCCCARSPPRRMGRWNSSSMV